MERIVVNSPELAGWPLSKILARRDTEKSIFRFVAMVPGDLDSCQVILHEGIHRDEAIAKLGLPELDVRIVPIPQEQIDKKDRPNFLVHLNSVAMCLNELYLSPVRSTLELFNETKLGNAADLYSDGPVILQWDGYPLQLSNSYVGISWRQEKSHDQERSIHVTFNCENKFRVLLNIGDSKYEVSVPNPRWLPELTACIYNEFESNPERFIYTDPQSTTAYSPKKK